MLPKSRPGDERHQRREGEDRAVHAHFVEPGHALGSQPHEEVAAPRRDEQAEAPPAIARSALSVSSWRTSRPRPAPSAARTAISGCRAPPFARACRFATFAQAMSSTNPTAPEQHEQRRARIADDRARAAAPP